MDNIIVAAYGTLRKGFGNSVLVDRSNNHLGTGITVEKYQMRASGIPYINKTPDTNIVVDLWKIDSKMLKNVDRLEGYDPDNHDNSWYKREKIKVNLKDEIIDAWIYFNDTSRGELVESGDYTDYINNKYK